MDDVTFIFLRKSAFQKDEPQEEEIP